MKKALSKTYKELGIDFQFPIEIRNTKGYPTYFEDSEGWIRWEYDEQGNETYYENSSDGHWGRREYDAHGKQTYYEHSSGYWIRREYDERGKPTYFEDSDDYWIRREYDAHGKQTYYEHSNGYWKRQEYDKQGKQTYSEDSEGNKSGTKRNSCATLDSSNEVLRITVTGAVPVKIILELV